jgi:hypothetical protein
MMELVASSNPYRISRCPQRSGKLVGQGSGDEFIILSRTKIY